MEKPALEKSNATKYVVYFPLSKNNDQDTAKEIREKVLDFVKKVFGGATVYRTEGETVTWGEEPTYALEILVEDAKEKEIRIEQLAWLILCYLDNLNLSKGRDPEETIWFYEQPVTLYKLYNPDLKNLERDET